MDLKNSSDMEMSQLNEAVVLSNPNTNFMEFPDSANLTANMTYVIRMNHTVVTMTIPEGVTLYFMGGMLLPASSNVTLTGRNTKIIAPAGQIFDASLNVGGTWNIDRAYPQWFGAQSYMDMTPYVTTIDSSPAINKAILMKGTGEVFLPRGMYKVNSTIEVKAGIELVGELGAYNGDCKEEDKKFGTILVPCNRTTNAYTNGFLMRINMKPGQTTWEVGYVNPGTTVKNIIFLNSWKNDPSGPAGISNLRGIYTAGSFVVDSCLWHYFKQAICNTFDYSDLRKIVNCTFNSPEDNHTGDPLYAFDLNSLGDALVFEHNGIHKLSKYAKALRVNMCNGGSIDANIINDDVLIENSKGIVFSANHMEEGAQVVINSSNVTSMNNFFQKGSNPNLVIGTSVVKSSGDLFLFYDRAYTARYHNNNVDQIPKDIPANPDDPDWANYQDYLVTNSYLGSISEYDVLIDMSSSLDVSQTYRYWVVTGVIGRVNTCGIKIVSTTGLALRDFNDYSHLLSPGGRIMPGCKVIKSAYVDNLSEPSSFGYGYHGDCKWHLPTGYYYYKYQILWDKQRKIIGQSGTYAWDGTGRIYMMNYMGDYTGDSSKDPRRGLLLHLANALGCGNQAMLRLYRGTSTNYTQYVDIPVSGTDPLYDNGISVCGFKWNTLPITENIISANTNITSIRYTGKNVECKAPTVPTQGTWMDGDIVYNTDPWSSNPVSYWIYLGGGWRAKQ